MDADNCEEYEESGLTFRFPVGQVFKPDAVDTKGLQHVKGCDFVWRKAAKKVWIVEVKSSAPKSGDTLQGDMKRIAGQFLHGVFLWLAAIGGRHTDRISLPGALSKIDAMQAKPQFILVVSALPRDAAQPLQDALQREIGAECRAFDMPPPLVLSGDRILRHFPVEMAS